MERCHLAKRAGLASGNLGAGVVSRGQEFAQYFREIWSKHLDELTCYYKLGDSARTVDVSHPPIIPWDRLIASSLWIAYEQAKQEQQNPPDLAWSQ